MNIKNKDLGQATQVALGRQIHQRLAFAGARESMAEALDRVAEAREYLANGETVVAAHRIGPAMGRIEAAMAQVEDGGREELAIIDALGELIPVFLLDAWLHEQRRGVLDKLARSLGWASSWSGEVFYASQDDTGMDLHVNASDGWRCTSGMPDMLVCGVGLTSLHAHLKCETLPETVARLTPWYSKSISMKGGRV
ncbi:hypothetical protein [Rhizobium sp. IBUN]|uniref:hypothetical protein n=1 Tax=Rhizobium sp. IBUN TaxID=1042326 RepID=UPI0018DBB0BA|nr:hypothetical protein [Rhizobium sp. IBUN]